MVPKSKILCRSLTCSAEGNWAERVSSVAFLGHPNSMTVRALSSGVYNRRSVGALASSEWKRNGIWGNNWKYQWWLGILFPRWPLVLLEKKNQILDEISGGFVKMGLVRLRARLIFKIRQSDEFHYKNGRKSALSNSADLQIVFNTQFATMSWKYRVWDRKITEPAHLRSKEQTACPKTIEKSAHNGAPAFCLYENVCFAYRALRRKNTTQYF